MRERVAGRFRIRRETIVREGEKFAPAQWIRIYDEAIPAPRGIWCSVCRVSIPCIPIRSVSYQQFYRKMVGGQLYRRDAKCCMRSVNTYLWGRVASLDGKPVLRIYPGATWRPGSDVCHVAERHGREEG